MSQSRQSTNGRPSHHSVSKPTVANSLFVKVKFNNTLPDIPFDPKFIVNPLDISRYVNYETTSLEQNAKHELVTPMDLGVDIDLILPERYAVLSNPDHDPDDDRSLIEDEPALQLTKKSPRDKPHSQLHNKVVPWLKKTEYISTEYNRYGSSNEKTETKVGYNVRKNLKEDEVFLDKESQIKAINETFEAAKKPINKHPTKHDVHATRVLPLLPDFETWKYYFAHVKFDSEPADPSKTDQMSQAIMKGAYDDDTNENFVVYFLPTEVTMTDRLIDQSNGLDYTEGKEYEYKSNREYTWSAKQCNDGDDFFFVFRDDAVYYNRLSMEVTLKKRRNKCQSQASSTLVVRYRDLNAEEIECQEEKMVQLRKPTPTVRQNMDLTAQSLEQSYEDMAQERKVGADATEDTIASPDAEEENSGSSSSSSGSSSPASSTPSSSSSMSSSEEESEDENNDSQDD